MKTYQSIPFKSVPGHDLYLDVYMPDAENPPLIMWIHGGGWHDLSRNWNLILPMVDYGFAVASVDYRYSDEGPFPTQMYDLKDALRYLKTHAADFGYDGSTVIVSGDSAGSHLACMVAVSAGNKDWEAEDFDYRVQACVDFCAPTLFEGGEGAVRSGLFALLYGCDPATKTGKVRAEALSPINYIDGSEPPFLILHGSEDPIVNPSNPRALRNKLEEMNVPVHMYFIPGGHHGLSGELVNRVILEFLDYYIRGKKTVITPELQDCHQRTVPIVKETPVFD